VIEVLVSRDCCTESRQVDLPLIGAAVPTTPLRPRQALTPLALPLDHADGKGLDQCQEAQNQEDVGNQLSSTLRGVGLVDRRERTGKGVLSIRTSYDDPSMAMLTA